MDKQRKTQIKKYIRLGIVALVVLLLAVMPLLASQNAIADGPQASILTATAQGRTIKTQLIGGGQLASNSTEKVTIPAEVKLTEYLVGNGNIVKKGDAIAAVDKVSVLSALADVQETLDYLSGQLANVSGKSDSDAVTAHAGGTVKTIYARQGESVREVMLRDGALAVLSLDGRMAVTIQRQTDLKAGSTVYVYLEDDTELEGKVESSSGGKLVVSIPDNNYQIGHKVTVTEEDGTRLGSGALYIHQAWNATAYYGTISAVSAREGDVLSAGKTLFELETGSYSAQFQILNAQRQEYEELMQELFKLYDSGLVTAPCDGIITGVDKSGSFLLAAESTGNWQVQLLSNFTPTRHPAYSVTLLSNETDEAPEDPGTPDLPGEVEPPVDPDAPVYTVTVGKVNESGSIDVGFTYANITDLSMVPTSFTSTGTVATWPLTGLVNRDLTPYSGAAVTGNLLFEVIPTSGSPFYVFAAVAPSGGQQMPGGNMSGGMPGGMGGGMPGGMGGSAATFEPYTLETLTIASVTSQEEMTLEITVDEQDIANLFVGQNASVTVEALTGQTFPATVTSISNTGTNEGGSSKFTAKLTLNKNGNMLPGMHASAFLTLATADNVLCVPVAALVEDGSNTIVYTDYSEKDDVLTNPVEVTTGVSDGEYVQILTGLSNGDTVHYAYYDTLEISNIPDAGGFSFG